MNNEGDSFGIPLAGGHEEAVLELAPAKVAWQSRHPSSLQQILGRSDSVRRLVSDVNQVARSNFNVVIIGETGSGKEIVAHAIHEASSCPKGPFVPVDCGAIPETLVEDELFGHEKGAFTSANARQVGKVEAACGGTLFLDEISNLPLGSQAKLLRALQEKTIFRIGSSRPIRVEIRLLASSNQDLLELAQAGSFRRDLYFRVSEFTIHVPPLRERREDILYLATHFVDLTNQELHKNITGFSESAIQALLAHPWPGNVRELRSCIRRGVLLADEQITEKHLHIMRSSGGQVESAGPVSVDDEEALLPLKEIVRRHTVKIEREVILRVLRLTGGNKAKAARLLRIDYKTIHVKVREYGIDMNKRGGL